MKTKIAIGSWAYIFGPYEKKPIPLQMIAKRLAKLGFDGIELCGFKPHAHPDLYLTKNDRKRLVKMLKDNGLEVCGYSADLTQFPPASNDKSVRDAYIKEFDKNLQFCKDCGIKVLRVDTVSSPPMEPGVKYQDAWNRITEIWRQCAQKCQEAGVLLVWEFEPGFIFNKPSEVIKLVNDIDHPNFKILFDTCHAQMCSVVGARQSEPKETLEGGIVEFAKLLSGKIGHIHLIDSDNTLHNNETSTHSPFGIGVIDFDEVLPAILEAGYTSDWWVIDLCFLPDAWDVTKQCKDFVDQLNKKYNG